MGPSRDLNAHPKPEYLWVSPNKETGMKSYFDPRGTQMVIIMYSSGK
jgi:hypothetical protein